MVFAVGVVFFLPAGLAREHGDAKGEPQGESPLARLLNEVFGLRTFLLSGVSGDRGDSVPNDRLRVLFGEQPRE